MHGPRTSPTDSVSHSVGQEWTFLTSIPGDTYVPKVLGLKWGQLQQLVK